MNRKYVEFGLPLVLLMVATALLAVNGSDLKLSAFFCMNGKWPVGELQPWLALRVYGYYPADLIGVIALLLLGAGLIKPSLARFRKPSVFLLLLLLLGPGLLVNSVFKDHWGRPRPREIVQFGGKRQFQEPWQPGVSGQGRSFPSGHAASAFYLAMPYFVLRRRSVRLAQRIYLAGTLYGLLMGIARITQGGHYVSDILWAWGMVHLTALALYYLLGLHREDIAAPVSQV